MKRAKKLAGRLTQEERDRLTTAAKAVDAGVRPGERCGNPVLDAKKRGTLCLKPAVAEREVPTGHGAEKVKMTFCAKHVAAIDANGGEVKCDREAADEALARWDAEQAKLPPHERRTFDQALNDEQAKAEAEEEAHMGRQLRRGRDWRAL